MAKISRSWSFLRGSVTALQLRRSDDAENGGETSRDERDYENALCGFEMETKQLHSCNNARDRKRYGCVQE